MGGLTIVTIYASSKFHILVLVNLVAIMPADMRYFYTNIRGEKREKKTERKKKKRAEFIPRASDPKLLPRLSK